MPVIAYRLDLNQDADRSVYIDIRYGYRSTKNQTQKANGTESP